MKTMCCLGYRNNVFVTTHAHGHMMNGTSCAQVHDLPQIHFGDNREGTLFCTNLASVRLEHSVCRGSLIYISGHK